MPYQEYAVSAEDVASCVAEELSRADVVHVAVQDIDGETIVDVPGTADPEGAARQVLGAFDDYAGGGTRLLVRVETSAPMEATAPPHGRILDEPPESPEAGEPRPHGR